MGLGGGALSVRAYDYVEEKIWEWEFGVKKVTLLGAERCWWSDLSSAQKVCAGVWRDWTVLQHTKSTRVVRCQMVDEDAMLVSWEIFYDPNQRSARSFRRSFDAAHWFLTYCAQRRFVGLRWPFDDKEMIHLRRPNDKGSPTAVSPLQSLSGPFCAIRRPCFSIHLHSITVLKLSYTLCHLFFSKHRKSTFVPCNAMTLDHTHRAFTIQ